MLELLRKLENILSDRNFFESNCTLSTQKSEGATGLTPRMTPRAKEPLLDQAGFLRLLHTAGIVGQVGGMVDDQYALDVYLKTYMRTGSRGLGTQPCIPFEVYQYCLWQIGAHSAKMDMKHLIAEPGLIDSNCLPTLIALEIGESRGKPTVDALEATRLELEQEISGGSGGWVSPHKMSITRARTATVPNSKVAVPGPGMYVKHLFSPFPNESIFPGAPKSSGGVRGWTWGSAEQRQFMKVTLQEIGLGPGPAAYGDNDLGMRRQQIGYGTGQLPGSARHAQFGTAERELSVAHATIAGMKGGLTCELLNGVPQARKPMLRKGDRKYVKDVVPTPQQLKEARNFLEYMFKQENLRKQAPPDMCRLVSLELCFCTAAGLLYCFILLLLESLIAEILRNKKPFSRVLCRLSLIF